MRKGGDHRGHYEPPEPYFFTNWSQFGYIIVILRPTRRATAGDLSDAQLRSSLRCIGLVAIEGMNTKM